MNFDLQINEEDLIGLKARVLGADDEDNAVDFLISLYDGYAKSEVYKKIVDEPLDKITEEDIDQQQSAT